MVDAVVYPDKEVSEILRYTGIDKSLPLAICEAVYNVAKEYTRGRALWFDPNGNEIGPALSIYHVVDFFKREMGRN